MIDAEEMVRRQQKGMEQVESLKDLERDVLRHYCSYAAEAMMKIAARTKVPVGKLVINALRNGIALGLQLDITGGEVQGRNSSYDK